MQSHTHTSAQALADLPNVSFLLAQELASIGLTTPRLLVEAGAENAWDRLRAAGLHADARTLLALAGAVADCPWQALPHARRLELLRHAFGAD